MRAACAQPNRSAAAGLRPALVGSPSRTASATWRGCAGRSCWRCERNHIRNEDIVAAGERDQGGPNGFGIDLAGNPCFASVERDGMSAAPIGSWPVLQQRIGFHDSVDSCRKAHADQDRNGLFKANVTHDRILSSQLGAARPAWSRHASLGNVADAAVG